MLVLEEKLYNWRKVELTGQELIWTLWCRVGQQTRPWKWRQHASSISQRTDRSIKITFIVVISPTYHGSSPKWDLHAGGKVRPTMKKHCQCQLCSFFVSQNICWWCWWLMKCIICMWTLSHSVSGCWAWPQTARQGRKDSSLQIAPDSLPAPSCPPLYFADNHSWTDSEFAKRPFRMRWSPHGVVWCNI